VGKRINAEIGPGQDKIEKALYRAQLPIDGGTVIAGMELHHIGPYRYTVRDGDALLVEKGKEVFDVAYIRSVRLLRKAFLIEKEHLVSTQEGFEVIFHESKITPKFLMNQGNHKIVENPSGESVLPSFSCYEIVCGILNKEEI